MFPFFLTSSADVENFLFSLNKSNALELPSRQTCRPQNKAIYEGLAVLFDLEGDRSHVKSLGNGLPFDIFPDRNGIFWVSFDVLLDAKPHILHQNLCNKPLARVLQSCRYEKPLQPDVPIGNRPKFISIDHRYLDIKNFCCRPVFPQVFWLRKEPWADWTNRTSP
jgi:hypothetical protein